MNENRSKKSFVIAALLLVIVGLSVAYAVLSQQLVINGVGTVKGSTWRIMFDNLNSPTIVGQATVDEDAALTNNSTTMTFAVSLRQPVDAVSYKFDTKNAGTIDAEVSAISLTGVNAAAEADVTYTLTYADGSTITVGDPLLAGQSRELLLTVTYDASATTVPEEDIILNLGATIDYTQR